MNDGETPESFEARRQRNVAKHINGNGMGTPLGQQALSWATPKTLTGGPNSNRASRRASGPDLQEQVCSHQVLSILDGRELSPTIRTLRPRLNPAFACWLMGLPFWWTNPAVTSSVRSEMAEWRCALRSRLQLLLGG